ncbi:MAG: hypothetical protein IKE02_03640 [Lachnospiraceae bacterium]|nr:hypothetical protein [Lachnospiraceae bacterium]
MPKNKEISDEVKRLSDIFADISADKRALVKNLIQNAAYMAVKLRELQELIDQDGLIEHYDNGGGQTGNKIGSAVQIYQKMLPSYNQVIKTLAGMLPSGEKDAAIRSADPMAEFLTQR